jgi:methionine synthase I (cobalamin-dependent)
LKLGLEGLEEQMETINRKGAEIAVEARPEGKFVAGDIGPSGKMLKPLGDISPEEMLENFSLQAAVLIAGGVDLLIIETMFSLQEAVAAVKGAKKSSDILLLASMTFTKTKKGFFTMMGENLDQCSSALADAGADMIGANCTLGSSEMIDLTKELRASTDKPILIQPNAGQPVVRDDVTFYEQTPSDFALDAKKITDAGADMIGGCCGTTPEFIRIVSETISGN